MNTKLSKHCHSCSTLSLFTIDRKTTLIIVKLIDIFPQQKRNLTTQKRIASHVTSVHEDALLFGMSMQINKNVRFFGTLHHLFQMKNLRKLLFITIVPYSVHVITRKATSVVAIYHTIWVQHRHQFKNKPLPGVLHLLTLSGISPKNTQSVLL